MNQYERPIQKSKNEIRFIEGYGGKIEYELKRSKRRHMDLLMDEDGDLQVAAHLKTPIKSIEEVIRTKEDWTRQCLQSFQDYPSISLENGEKLPYLRNDLSIRLQEDTSNHIELNPFTHELTIKIIHLQSKTLIKTMLIAWFKERAREYFSQRLAHFAQKLNVKYQQFSLTCNNSYIGQCLWLDGKIQLDWRVIYCRPAVIDYLIIHELAHLRVPDHSDRF